ncbi:MAG TPA: hypothetical protein VG737_08590 [Cyclobacteriaceae bacterium]|nr:hypothetical protein [Cyclobacteriaceae bacterium]
MPLKNPSLLIALLGLAYAASGQNEFERQPKSIQEVTKILNADTVLFFYNRNWRLVFQACAEIVRVSRVNNATGYFDGSFTDYYKNSKIAATGSYNNSLKEGLFQVFYESGQLSQVGNYLKDKKNGIWEYYYENGNKQMTLAFRDGDLSMLELWDANQNKLVDGGNGHWVSREDPANSIELAGNVVNGKPDGTWTRTDGSFKLNSEEYEGGKLIGGKFYSRVGGAEKYTSMKSLINVDKKAKYEMAEKFEVTFCYRVTPPTDKLVNPDDAKDSIKVVEKARPSNTGVVNASYPGGQTRFYRELQEGLRLNQASLSYGIIRIGFTITTSGKMADFRKLSSTGYEDQVITVLMTMREWKPRKVNGVVKPEYQSINLNVADFMHNTDR